MNAKPIQPDVFFHIRVVVGIVTGLSVARLLNGLARFVQHPSRTQIYPVHLGWVIFLLLAIIHFWWFELRLNYLQQWSFQIYLFVILYAVLFFFVCAILLPDQMTEYTGYRDYFDSRRKWFFGFLASLFAVDVIDTAIKGWGYFHALGIEYPLRQGIFFILSVIAMFVADRRYHLVFAAGALLYQMWWILRMYAMPV